MYNLVINYYYDIHIQPTDKYAQMSKTLLNHVSTVYYIIY